MTFSHIQKPDVVLFDWDATLANTYPLLEKAHNHVLQTLGMPPRPDGWLKPIFGMTREESYIAAYGRSDEEIDRMFMSYVQAHHLKETQPMAGAEALLQFLSDCGIPMGVVTNKRPPLVSAEIDAFGWRNYFDVVVGAGEAKANKPSGAPLILALERLSYKGDASQVWFFGDSATDQMAAKDFGCPFIAYEDGSMPPLNLEAYQPQIVVCDYDNLLQKLRA